MKEKIKRFIKGYFIVCIVYEAILALGIITGAVIKMVNGTHFKDAILKMSES